MANEDMREELPLVLTIPQVASLLNISEQTARNEARAGRIPAVHCGRKWGIPRERFLRYLDGEADAKQC